MWTVILPNGKTIENERAKFLVNDFRRNQTMLFTEDKQTMIARIYNAPGMAVVWIEADTPES